MTSLCFNGIQLNGVGFGTRYFLEEKANRGSEESLFAIQDVMLWALEQFIEQLPQKKKVARIRLDFVKALLGGE